MVTIEWRSWSLEGLCEFLSLLTAPVQSSMCERRSVSQCRSKFSQCRSAHTPFSQCHRPYTLCPLKDRQHTEQEWVFYFFKDTQCLCNFGRIAVRNALIVWRYQSEVGWGAELSGVSVPHTDYTEQDAGCFLSLLTHGHDCLRNVRGGHVQGYSKDQGQSGKGSESYTSYRKLQKTEELKKNWRDWSLPGTSLLPFSTFLAFGIRRRVRVRQTESEEGRGRGRAGT